MNPMMMAIIGTIAGMIIAFVLLTLKNSAAKKAGESSAQDLLKKHKRKLKQLDKKPKMMPNKSLEKREINLKTRWKKRKSIFLILSEV